jgi:hypothetical protein
MFIQAMRLIHQNRSGGMLRGQVNKRRHKHKKSLNAFKYSRISGLSHHIISQTEQGPEISTQSHDHPEQDSFWEFSSEEGKLQVFLPSVPMPLGLPGFSSPFCESLKVY